MTTHEFQHKLMHLQKHLILYAYKLTSDNQNARDLLQETNLKALNHRDKFVRDTNFRAWTFTIMKNTFVNDYRRRARQIFVDTENLFPTKSYLKSHENYNPSSIYQTKELERTIESMNDKLRIPFKMHLEGFKYKEIAKKLDLKLGTVKSRIFFARKELMNQLSENVNA